MSDEAALMKVHPEGELQKVENEPWETAVSLDTFAGKIQFKWAPDAEVSSLGQMPFFIEFLKTSGLFENWVKDCPLHYTSPNAPQKRDVLGTILLSVLAGHWRYAHISALRSDGVNPELLGMTKVASEDSVRRALSALPEEESASWLKQHLKASYKPLLEEPWALDVDTTVKPLYGHQEDAKVGYNPQKPGDLRTPITAISSRTYGWWWTWKYRRGIKRRPRLRSRSCGRSWTERRSPVIPVFCGETASGETSGR